MSASNWLTAICLSFLLWYILRGDTHTKMQSHLITCELRNAFIHCQVRHHQQSINKDLFFVWIRNWQVTIIYHTDRTEKITERNRNIQFHQQTGNLLCFEDCWSFRLLDGSAFSAFVSLWSEGFDGSISIADESVGLLWTSAGCT